MEFRILRKYALDIEIATLTLYRQKLLEICLFFYGHIHIVV